MEIKNPFSVVLPLIALATPLSAQSVDLVPSEGALNFADGSSLYLSAHVRAVTGTSSANPAAFFNHAHDPFQEGLTLQGLEASLNYKSKYIEAFATGALFTDADNDFETEDEEYFVKFVNLPGGFELRGGQFLNRIGLQNNVHLHGWSFVDANLSTGQFLGEEGLTTEGGELSWLYSGDVTRFGFSVAAGKASEHEEEEEEEGEEEEHSESVENSFFTGDIITARVFVDYLPSDFHLHRVGFNIAHGDNAFGRDTTLGSIDYTYTWRENGLEPGGREFQIGGEAFFRSTEWVHEENDAITGTADQNSFMFRAGYTFSENWRADLRYGFIEGVTEGPLDVGGEIENGFEIDERKRLSLALTHKLFNHKSSSAFVRAQYNHDDLEDLGSEDSFWLQFGFDFGGAEIR